MKLEDKYRCLVEGYYGIQEMDEYDTKVYILKEIEEYIKSFTKEYKIEKFNYKKEAEFIKDNISIKTKLQSSLIILNQINGPMDLILLIKKRLKNIGN